MNFQWVVRGEPEGGDGDLVKAVHCGLAQAEVKQGKQTGGVCYNEIYLLMNMLDEIRKSY